MNLAAAFTVAVLFGCGVHLMVRGDAVKLTAGTLLLTNSAILLLVSAGLGADQAPFLPVESPGELSDPLVQALAITGIVIGFGATVLMLRVALAVAETHDSIQMSDLVAAEIGEDSDDPEVPLQSEARAAADREEGTS